MQTLACTRALPAFVLLAAPCAALANDGLGAALGTLFMFVFVAAGVVSAATYHVVRRRNEESGATGGEGSSAALAFLAVIFLAWISLIIAFN